MTSKVKFVAREEKDKYVLIHPRTPEIIAALEKHKGKDHFKVEGSDYMGHDTIEVLMNLEILGTTEFSEKEDHAKATILREEILKIRESKLLHKLFHKLKTSKTEEDKILFEALKKRLDAMKLLDVLD